MHRNKKHVSNNELFHFVEDLFFLHKDYRKEWRG